PAAPDPPPERGPAGPGAAHDRGLALLRGRGPDRLPAGLQRLLPVRRLLLPAAAHRRLPLDPLVAGPRPGRRRLRPVALPHLRLPGRHPLPALPRPGPPL